MGLCFAMKIGMQSLPKIGGRMSRHEVYKVQSPSMIVGIWNFSNNYLSGIRRSGNKKEFTVKGNQEFKDASWN